MDINATEVIIHFCLDHMDTDLSLTHPDFKFNWFASYAPKKCAYDGCSEKAYNMMIGVKIPDKVGLLPTIEDNIAVKEIMEEAIQALSGGDAIDKLTAYLYFKIRMFSYDCGDAVAFFLLKDYAKIILSYLKIDLFKELSKEDIMRILSRLRLLPEDFNAN